VLRFQNEPTLRKSFTALSGLMHGRLPQACAGGDTYPPPAENVIKCFVH